MDRYMLYIETTNPDLVARVREAFETVGLDVDSDGRLHDLTAELVDVDATRMDDHTDPLWSTVYAPDQDTVLVPKETAV